jgi:hypothetical protein
MIRDLLQVKTLKYQKHYNYEGGQYSIFIHPSITCQNAIVVIYIYIYKKKTMKPY